MTKTSKEEKTKEKKRNLRNISISLLIVMSIEARNLIRSMKVIKMIRPILTVVFKGMILGILRNSMMWSQTILPMLFLKRFR